MYMTTSSFHVMRLSFCCLRSGSSFLNSVLLHSRILTLPDFSASLPDEAIQHSRMRVNDVVAPAIQAACRLSFRQMHRECPILVGRRKAAIPGFVLHSCRKHDGDALCTILVEYLLGRLFVQVHPVEMAGYGVLNIILAGDIRAMGEPEKLQLTVLARICCGFVVYSQLKWVMLEKPALRDAYVRGKINAELDTVLAEAYETFDRFSEDYIVVFN